MSTAAAADTFILFSVAGTTYALNTRDVRHMEMVENVTRVPNAAAHVDGVVFSRGEVVPAVNLRARFGFERVPYDLRTRLIVLSALGRTVGLIVDEAREFLRIPDETIQSPQQAMAAGTSEYVAGVASLGGRLVVVLAVEPLLTAAVASDVA